MNTKNIFIIFILLLSINTVSGTLLFYTSSNQRYLNLSEFGAVSNTPSVIIMEELPSEFLQNVTYIDSITLNVGSGAYYNNLSHAPNGKLYFKIYKNIAGVWVYQTGSFFNAVYYDIGSPITNSFTPLYIDKGYDYGVGFYTDVSDTTNSSWILLGGGITYDVYSGYNVWRTNNNRICNYNTVYVCDPNNINGYNQQFTLDVNSPKVHTVYPAQNILISNGYPNDIGSIYIVINGQTDIPPTPTPTSTPDISPTVTIVGVIGSEGISNSSNNTYKNNDYTTWAMPNFTKSVLKTTGYAETTVGMVLFLTDYMQYYVIFGFMAFMYIFMKRGN
jgi:hypothetical protein